MITAKVVADSKNAFGNRITTMVVTMPRIILAEFNTHRMFSRNSASSRAIPFEKMVQSVKENPFIPIAWQKDHKGMQGNEYFDSYAERILNTDWLYGRDLVVTTATLLYGQGATKQLCNRMLEPFMWHTVIVTATEWENFFALRCPQYKVGKEGTSFSKDLLSFRSWKDVIKYVNDNGVNQRDFPFEEATLLDRLSVNSGQAEIHMMALAEAMWDAYNESQSKELRVGEWHIPFGDNIDEDMLEAAVLNDRVIQEDFHHYTSGKKNLKKEVATEYKIKIATARCARVSYTVVGEEDRELNYENDIKLHDRLAASGHWSPFEHCSEAMDIRKRWSDWSGNFRGFVQYRKTFEGENKT